LAREAARKLRANYAQTTAELPLMDTNVLQCVAVCAIETAAVLQCVAVCCSVLQCVAVCAKKLLLMHKFLAKKAV